MIIEPTLPEAAFITFYYMDGTKETVQAYTFHMAVTKCKRTTAITDYMFWEYGRGEKDPYTWDSVTKKWRHGIKK